MTERAVKSLFGDEWIAVPMSGYHVNGQELTDAERRVFAVYADRWRRGIGTMSLSTLCLAVEAGISERLVQQCRTHLEEMGALEVVRPGGSGRGDLRVHRLAAAVLPKKKPLLPEAVTLPETVKLADVLKPPPAPNRAVNPEQPKAQIDAPPKRVESAPSSQHALLTLEEAADLARAPIGSVRHWIATGRLASVRPGRRRLVRRTDLATLLGVAPSDLR